MRPTHSGTLLVAALLGPSTLLTAAGDPVDGAMANIRPEALRAHMRLLADDLLEGRAPGTRGHEIAARYVASEFEAAGLEPAGDGGSYFQSVPLRSLAPDEAHTTLTLLRAGQSESLELRKDFIAPGDAARTDTSIEAPVVYVGFGVSAPELGYDDYAGVDVKGKIVALLFGAPRSFQSSLRAHYSSRIEKAATAVRHGAAGALLLDSADFETVYPFTDRVRDLVFPVMRWLGPDGTPNDYMPELRASAALSMAATVRLFAGAKSSSDDAARAAKEGRTASFEMPVVARIRLSTRHRDLRSPNVVARLQGSDPALRSEYVVFTAHLDHLGIGEPVKGDAIYNGAIDNASGTACLIEIAKAFGRMQPRPRRSLLFVAVTAEEEGLLGSDYFAHFPTVPKEALAANVNMDGAAMLWPIADVVVFGAEHSSLGKQVDQAAARLSLSVSPDPMPEQVLFIRSDQYSFVKQGVPAIGPDVGLKSSDPAIRPKEILERWMGSVYHTPQDDMNQALDFEAGAKYARFSLLCGYLAAQQGRRPTWNPGDFFGAKYGRTVAGAVR